MQRVLTTATLVGLLVATAAAFAITERLKLVKSPIYGTVISSPVFSPTCRCARFSTVSVSLKFRRREHVTVTILSGERVVRTLASGLPVPRGRNVFRWDGKTDFATLARDGVYRVQLHLADEHRTILLPNTITLDTTAPQILAAPPNRTQISPDGDRLGDTVTLHYVLNKPAHVLVYLHGRLIIRGRSHLPRGGVVWTGKVNGRLLKPGVVTLEIGAVDLGGNVTPVADRARVRIEIRYIKLANRHITGVAPGAVFDIGVSTDAKLYRYRLGARHGVKAGPVLRLRAPGKPGAYRLTVTERGHSDTAMVVVG